MPCPLNPRRARPLQAAAFPLFRLRFWKWFGSNALAGRPLKTHFIAARFRRIFATAVVNADDHVFVLDRGSCAIAIDANHRPGTHLLPARTRWDHLVKNFRHLVHRGSRGVQRGLKLARPRLNSHCAGLSVFTVLNTKSNVRSYCETLCIRFTVPGVIFRRRLRRRGGKYDGDKNQNSRKNSHTLLYFFAAGGRKGCQPSQALRL
jgi:hypothetical protein